MYKEKLFELMEQEDINSPRRMEIANILTIAMWKGETEEVRKRTEELILNPNSAGKHEELCLQNN